MLVNLPLAVQPLIAAYLVALEPLQARFYGIYIYGSLALDAFDEHKSDIDVVALTHGELSAPELAQLAAIHSQLGQKQPLGKRFEVTYLPLANLGKYNTEIAPYPHFADGKFALATYGDLNAVTWWLIKHKGICLFGVAKENLELNVEWADVLATMRYNLEVYWAGKAKKPHLFLTDYWVEFAVTTLCRILTTIQVEEGEIISKSVALKRWRNRLPPRFQLLIDETQRFRHHPDTPSLYRFRLKRMFDTLAFINYVREQGRTFTAEARR